MSNLYHVDRVKQQRNYKKYVVIAGIIAAVFCLIWWLLLRDISGSESLTIDEVGVRGTVESSVKTKKIKQPTYSIEVPVEWRKIETGSNYIKLQNTKVNETARFLDIYVNTLPGDNAVNKMLPINEAPGGKITYGELSDHCRDFTQTASKLETPEPEPSLWGKIDFTCNFIKNWNIIGTGISGEGLLGTVEGEKTKEKYYFVYTDHSGRPDINPFYDVLLSFRAK